jgi:hypothetical protein
MRPNVQRLLALVLCLIYMQAPLPSFAQTQLPPTASQCQNLQQSINDAHTLIKLAESKHVTVNGMLLLGSAMSIIAAFGLGPETLGYLPIAGSLNNESLKQKEFSTREAQNEISKIVRLAKRIGCEVTF